MKPDGASGDMEEEDWAPQQLFEGMGFLIMEARIPHEATAKGRIDGPHCPSVQWDNVHVCSKLSKECRKAEQVRRQMALLWRNGIPMCIEVALYPNCSHGVYEAEMLVTEGGAMGLVTEENHILLERWNIHVTPKRHVDKSDGCVTPRFLLQAVRSHLHFSQLSAWLASTKGNLPNTIVYRLYAPGEFGSDSFCPLESTDHHSFPPADLAQVTAKVSVEALGRVHTIPTVFCKYGSPDSSKTTGKGKRTQPEETAEHAFAKLSLEKSQGALAKNWTNNNPHAKKKPNRSAPREQEYSSGNHQSVNQNTNAGLSDSPNSSKPKVKLKPLDFSATAKPNTDKGRNLLLSQSNMTKRKDSPKVLFTSSSNMSDTQETFYKKRYLDFDNPGEKDLFCDNPDDREVIKYTSKFSSGFAPQRNTAEELEAYLATIAERLMWKEEQIKQIPVTKCKFFIGDESNESTGNKTRTNLCDTPKLSLQNELAAYDELCKNLYQQKLSDLQQRVRESTPERKDLEKCEQILTSDSSLTHAQKFPNFPEVVSPFSSQKEVSWSPPCTNMELDSAFEREVTLNCAQDTKSRQSVTIDTYSICDVEPMQTKNCDLVERPIDKAQTAPGDLDRLIIHGKTLELFECQSALDRVTKISCDATTSRESRKSHFPDEDNSNNNMESGVCYSANGTCIQRNLEQLSMPYCANQDPVLAWSPVSNAALLTAARVETAPSVCKSLLRGDNYQLLKNGVPSQPQISSFREALHKSASMIFNSSTGLPTRSSPAPIKKKSSGKFDYDSSLISTRAIKNAISCSKLSMKLGPSEGNSVDDKPQQLLSTSAPASTNSLLGNFEESVLNGRIEPVGVVEGFMAEIGASGSFCPKHITLPVTSYFFSLSDDNAPSPYLGHINLETAGKKGYHVPKAGTVQVTLFNPNKTVVKMFVVRYDLCDMPAHSQTFLRQRTLYMPVNKDSQTDCSEPSYLRYLIHLRFFSSKAGKIYLHTDMRLIFARDKFEFDPRIANYELRSFTEGPKNPKFSPKR